MSFKGYTPPIISSTVASCPNPFHLETYQGCNFNCLYCYSRNSHYSKDSTIRPNDYNKFKKVLEFWTKHKDKVSYKNSEKMFFLSRIPLLIGTKFDPVPDIEKITNTTENFLRVLDKYNYPVRILTKNPEGLFNILTKFDKKLNLAVNITISNFNKDLISVIEPRFSIENRLFYISKLNELGYKVLVNMRPFIYLPEISESRIIYNPKFCESEITKILRVLDKLKCWGFSIYPLQLKRLNAEKEREDYDKIYKGFYEQYKSYCSLNGFYYTLKPEFQYDLKNIAERASKGLNLKYIHSMDCFFNDNQECCGTQRLTAYSTFNYNIRAREAKKFEAPELINCSFRGFGDIMGRGYKFNKKQTIKKYVDYRIKNYDDNNY